MKISIRVKLFFISIALILITATGISAIYYLRTKQDKQRESGQRIQIAFDIIFDDFENQIRAYQYGMSNFLREDLTLNWAAHSYNQDPSQISSPDYIVSYVVDVANELKKFGDAVLVNQLALYAADRRLLITYSRDAEQGNLGVYARSAMGNDAYLALDDPEYVNLIWTGEKPITERFFIPRRWRKNMRI